MRPWTPEDANLKVDNGKRKNQVESDDTPSMQEN